MISKSRLYGMLAVCFLFGFVAATVYESGAQDGSRRRSRSRLSSKELMETLQLELELDPLQKGMTEVVLDEGIQRLNDSGRKWKADYHQIREEMYDQLRNVLSSDQVDEFNAIVERKRKKH